MYFHTPGLVPPEQSDVAVAHNWFTSVATPTWLNVGTIGFVKPQVFVKLKYVDAIVVG